MNAMASQCEKGRRDGFGWPNPKCQLQEELDPVIAIQHYALMLQLWEAVECSALCLPLWSLCCHGSGC